MMMCGSVYVVFKGFRFQVSKGEQKKEQNDMIIIKSKKNRSVIEQLITHIVMMVSSI